ncbi:MAG: SufD family Fe-S cluster assembly protein, partial [Eggerthellaceae bacterium]|nr:SufD family Fe-S cluster assembly protein [Eggerthellaceae bacterium]
MAVDLTPIDKDLLKELTGYSCMPDVAVNIRKDGQLLERHNNANIEIVTKSDNPGIDIFIKANSKNERVFIPVIVTKSGLKDVVYNSFHIGENARVEIIAGCGIHNDSYENSQHDGIHEFFLEKGSRVTYIEKHYGEGEGTGERVLNPMTKVKQSEGSFCQMNLIQLKGVTHTNRNTIAELGKDSKLIVNEKLLTHGDQFAKSDMEIELNGECSSVQVISRSVAQDDSVQVLNPLVIGNQPCHAHVQCDAIIMGNAKVKAIPGIKAACEDAQLVHEAAIGKIAGDQIT